MLCLRVFYDVKILLEKHAASMKKDEKKVNSASVKFSRQINVYLK